MEEVASMAGVSLGGLAKIELGKVSPSIVNFLRVCAAVGEDPKYMIARLGPVNEDIYVKD
jgi:transcriptional regulator with XRE-family HTH domain